MGRASNGSPFALYGGGEQMSKEITKTQLGNLLIRLSDYFLQLNEDFTGATSSVAGASGMVPAPLAGDNTKYLRRDGTWATVSGGGGDGDGVPLGTIIAFSGSTNPSGYLECNGAAVSRTMYPDLFDCIGTKYGAGDGSTTFNLPNKSFIESGNVPVFGNGKNLAFTDGSILFGPRTSSTSAMAYTTQAYGKDVGAAQSSGTGLTSGKIAGVATKSLLGNTPENSGLIAEMQTSSDVVYLIKAFDGQTPDSALIDITQYAQALANAQVPTGMILPCATDNPQTGYLLCDGSAVSRSTYSSLYSAIGTTWGSGDGSNTFNLPNLNGYWLKGSSTAGSSVSAGLPNLKGYFSNGDSNASSVDGVLFVKNGTITGATQSGGSADSKIEFNASNYNSIYGASTTVSVSSKTVRYMIKY
jgi:microcystin-dependent protein